jgi:hypothetical protein
VCCRWSQEAVCVWACRVTQAVRDYGAVCSVVLSEHIVDPLGNKM